MSIDKVFVTGGSGFLGINLIRSLRAKGVSEIRVLDIAPFDYPEASEPWLKFTLGDVRDAAAVDALAEGCDVIVNTAAALPLYSKEDIRTTEVDGIRNVLAAARKFNVKMFDCIDLTFICGVGCEDWVPTVTAEQRAERVLANAEDGQIVTVIRPKSFVGPERLGVFALFYDWAYTGHGFPMIGSGANRYQLMDVEDLDEAIWLAMTGPEDKVNTEFNTGAAEFTTMKEDYQAVLDRAGHGKKIRGLPVKPVVFILRILEKLHLSPLYPWVYATASTDSFVSIDKIRGALGWNPRYSNKQALVRNYDWYVAHLDEFKGKSGVSHRVPWKQGLLAVAKWFF